MHIFTCTLITCKEACCVILVLAPLYVIPNPCWRLFLITTVHKSTDCLVGPRTALVRLDCLLARYSFGDKTPLPREALRTEAEANWAGPALMWATPLRWRANRTGRIHIALFRVQSSEFIRAKQQQTD
jgi:hypothetical protein